MAPASRTVSGVTGHHLSAFFSICQHLSAFVSIASCRRREGSSKTRWLQHLALFGSYRSSFFIIFQHFSAFVSIGQYLSACVSICQHRVSQEAGGIIGDEMGLGKTIQVPPTPTLEPYVINDYGPMGVLGGWAFSYERGTPVTPHRALRGTTNPHACTNARFSPNVDVAPRKGAC